MILDLFLNRLQMILRTDTKSNDEDKINPQGIVKINNVKHALGKSKYFKGINVKMWLDHMIRKSYTFQHTVKIILLCEEIFNVILLDNKSENCCQIFIVYKLNGKYCIIINFMIRSIFVHIFTKNFWKWCSICNNISVICISGTAKVL